MRSGQPLTSGDDDAIAELCEARRDQSRLRRVLAEGEELAGSAAAVWGWGHVRFTVRGKAYAYYLNNHHDDGLLALACKSTHERQEELIASDPDRFRVPAYLGKDGWVSIRLDLRSVDWAAVREMLTCAWVIQSPKRRVDRRSQG